MKLSAFNRFCGALPHVHHVVQWGGAHVWKVGGAQGKVFALARPSEDGSDVHVSFKCSAMSYDLLKEQEGLRPAPYLASRGLTWVQRFSQAAMDDAALRDYLRESHRLAAQNLTKALRIKLGLIQ